MEDKPKCDVCNDSQIERYDAGHGNIGERECSWCCEPTFSDDVRRKCIEQTGFDPQIDDDNGGFL